jgi:hypothetical protein
MFRLPHEQVPGCGGSSRACDQADTQDDGQGTSRRGPRPNDGAGIGQHPVNSDRIRDVLDLTVAERLIAANKFLLNLFVDAARDKDISRFGNSLKPRCNVDAITVDVIGFDNDISEVYSNSILYPPLAWERRIAPDHALLDNNGAADGFDRAVEHRQKAVAGIGNELAAVLCEVGLDEFAPLPRHPGECAFLVKLHEPAVAGDIGREDRRKAAVGLVFGHAAIPMGNSDAAPAADQPPGGVRYRLWVNSG